MALLTAPDLKGGKIVADILACHAGDRWPRTDHVITLARKCRGGIATGP